MIELEHVTKQYGRKEILHSLSLQFPDKKLVAIIGQSGCGKTTLLKMINRLIPITSGHIRINGEDIHNIDPVMLRRKIGYVIQQVGLFPHMTVQQNLELVLQLHKIPKEDYLDKIHEVLHTVSLPEGILPQYPIELSGGQQQRIGVARALITNPDVILMDEPFSAVDPLTRASLQKELKQLQKHLQKTIIFVTHDMDEAVKISDYICLMKDGSIEVFDKTENVLRHPQTPYVKAFLGKNRIWNYPEFIKAEDLVVYTDNICQTTDTLDICFSKVRNKKQPFLAVIDRKNKQFDGLLDLPLLKKHLKDPVLTAADIMHSSFRTVYMYDSLPTVFQAMQLTPFSYLIVLDDKNQFVGIITQYSLLKQLGAQYTLKKDVM